MRNVLKELNKEKDPDWEMVLGTRDAVSVPLRSGRSLREIFDVYKVMGFGGNMGKLSFILEKLGLRQRRRGRIPRHIPEWARKPVVQS